jgi:Circularly permuted ATP-grasp type 2/A predicted alpha-helical domain with a conserved ER motif.
MTSWSIPTAGRVRTRARSWRPWRRLNHFVDDVYHAREIIHDGKVPWELVVSRPAFARAAHGIRPPGGVYCHVSGCDLVRDGDGTWKVLEDNVRTPSGISYVPENRRAMTRLLPGLFEHYRVRPVDHYPALLRTALEEVAPTGGEEEATVVVWTPGPYNSAYFEHTFLARQMGVELVEASDLVVRDAVCHIRTTRGLQRVHAIYRRIDDDFMDPLEFRPDSVLGVPRALLDRPPAGPGRAHLAHARRRLPRRPAGPPGRPRRRAAVLGRAADDRVRRAAGHALLARRGAAAAHARRRPPDVRAGLRDPGARGRDVFSGEMWETINTFHLGLLQRNISAAVQTGPYSVYAYVRERCGQFWGVTSRTMLRDEAHAFL